MNTAFEFNCFSCKHPVSILNGDPTFCDTCKTLYWINDKGEIECRMAHPVEPEPKVKC